jgi:hypothetical protein
VSTLTLETPGLRADFDRASGALVGLVSTLSGWPILGRPRLGLSFKLLVPVPGRRNNPVRGERCTPAAVEPVDGGLDIRWGGVESDHAGRLPIALSARVRPSGRGLAFSMVVENGSAHTIENVTFPYLGDVRRPPGAAWFKTFLWAYAAAQEWPLWPTYQNLRGYFGVDHPTQLSPGLASCGAPMAPFVLLRGEHEGLYAGVGEARDELVAWQTELRPGWGSSIDFRVPPADELSGKPVQTLFGVVHVPFIEPGETRTLTTIVLETFEGDWQRGADIYAGRRRTWMSTPPLPGWLRDPHAWQQVHINSPEDELRVRFADLPRIGEECARSGVKAIQLVGWNAGGQDQGNPAHDPEPRLGTVDELRAAIARIRSLGVKVVLFAKFTWADRATEWFRRDLVRLAVKDPHGDYYLHPGYQYQTATQLLDVNTKRLVPMCFLAEEYLRLCEREFAKMLDLGADGILFDECFHHNPALLCFDVSHGHRRAALVYANDRELIRRFAALAAARGTEFVFAGESCYDAELERYHLSYHRSENPRHVPLSRYLLPGVPFMTAVTGFDDREMINQCLLYRYVVSYEPFNFKGLLSDMPLTVAYGRAMDGLRSELREYFWDGTFRHEAGARVAVDGRPHHPYAVFRAAATGAVGVVVANYGHDAGVTATVVTDVDEGWSATTLSRWRLVDDPTWRRFDGSVVVPPRGAAVIV